MQGASTDPRAIVAVADVYDALTSDRPYRAAIWSGNALELIRADPGLDPVVVAALDGIVG